MSRNTWLKYNQVILESFILFNLAFLSVDILLAHSYNNFHHWAEWIPFVFSILSAIILTPPLIYCWTKSAQITNRVTGYCLGSMAIIIGILGMFLHLGNSFFLEQTLKNLVYTAPFAAPLAYTGLGFLLILNRMVPSLEKAWSEWIVFFALGGCIGNFALSLCDHAQNGFFHFSEWLPVICSAYAISFLILVIAIKPSKTFYRWCFWVLFIQCLIGIAGFFLHLDAIIHHTTINIVDKFRYGAPLFAPLLLPNISLLAFIGIYDLQWKTTSQICKSGSK